MRRNDFMARPTSFSGGATLGTRTHPGFHTATEMRTTYAYANQKATDLVRGDRTIGDYPVVVALDMQAHRPLPDYDAINFVARTLVDAAREAISIDGSDPLRGLDQYVELYAYEPQEAAKTATQLLVEHGAYVTINPASSLLVVAENKTDPAAFIRQVAEGNVSDEDLMQITGQFRYDEDVPSSNITAVYYLKPWWEDVLPSYDAADFDEDVAAGLEAEGWNVLTEEDTYGPDPHPEETLVWSRKPPRGARVEFHGTSYNNLVLAAPELAKRLPVPPSPYEPE